MKTASSLMMVVAVMLATCVASYADIPLLNAGFEAPVADGSEPAPDNWGFFTSGPNSSGVSSNIALSGGQSLIFFAPPSGTDDNSYQGYFQNVTLSLSTSDVISFSGYFRADAFALAGNAIGKIGIEFHRGDNSEINRIELQILPGDLSSSEWRQFTVSGSPSDGTTAYVSFTLVEVNGTSPNSGIYYVDNVSAVPEPSSWVLVAMALAGFAALVKSKRG